MNLNCLNRYEWVGQYNRRKIACRELCLRSSTLDSSPTIFSRELWLTLGKHWRTQADRRTVRQKYLQLGLIRAKIRVRVRVMIRVRGRVNPNPNSNPNHNPNTDQS
jgi:hypothetical protein